MKKTINKYGINTVIYVGVIFFLLWIFSLYLVDKLREKNTGWTNSIFTNPALNYTELKDSIMNNKNINLWNQINDYISYKKSLWDITHLSVYYRNLNNWWWFGINEKEEFSPASLMKLPILLAYVKKSESVPWFLDQKIIYKKNPNLPDYKQNIPPEKQLKEWQEYSLWDVLQYMIIYSDNHASSLLELNLPSEELQRTFTDIGIQFPEIKNWSFDNNVKVRDYAAFFRILFNSSYLNRKNSEKILKLLSQIDFCDGLNQWVPGNTLISHKFWERGIIWSNGREEKQLHDCGIIYYPNHPYVLCVMTRWYDWSKLKTLISDISQMIYTETKNQYWEDPLDISSNWTDTFISWSNIDASWLQSN